MTITRQQIEPFKPGDRVRHTKGCQAPWPGTRGTIVKWDADTGLYDVKMDRDMPGYTLAGGTTRSGPGSLEPIPSPTALLNETMVSLAAIAQAVRESRIPAIGELLADAFVEENLQDFDYDTFIAACQPAGSTVPFAPPPLPPSPVTAAAITAAAITAAAMPAPTEGGRYFRRKGGIRRETTPPPDGDDKMIRVGERVAYTGMNPNIRGKHGVVVKETFLMERFNRHMVRVQFDGIPKPMLASPRNLLMVPS